LILKHCRHIHKGKAAEKVVCCEPGLECLFPSATSYFYSYKNPIADKDRCSDGSYSKGQRLARYNEELRKQLIKLYPDHTIDPLNYDCPWHTSDSVKFMPKVPHILPAVNVTIGTRKRNFVPEKNFLYWDYIISNLKANGLTIGLIGAKDTSFDISADAKSWDHPNGPTFGTVDLLANCSWFIGTDSAMGHLSALMDVNSIIFREVAHGNPDLTGIMARANNGLHVKLPDVIWHDKKKILSTIMTLTLGCRRKPILLL
jgi:hypothetical protein